MPLGLSVHNFISSVGADAGFASVVGLAILILLYFAHARETANLQEEAAELAERLEQAELKLAQLSRQEPAPAPQPSPAPQAAPASSIHAARITRPAGATGPAAGAAPAAAIPAAPAGVGAPALAAATRVVPTASVASPSPPAPAAQPSPAPPAAQPNPSQPAAAPQPRPSQPAAGPQAAAATQPPASDFQQRPEQPPSGAPGPVTAAGGANGGGSRERVPAPVGASGRRPAPQRAPARARAGTASLRRTEASTRAPMLRGPASSRSSAGRRAGLLVGVLVVVAAIAALVVLTSGSGGTQRKQSAARTTNAPSASPPNRAVTFNPASVTVSVLNGTATNQLAHRVSAKLAADGYKQGAVATASSQTQTSTVVAYLPGHRTDALHVATALKLGPASVQAIDQGTQQVACPPPSPCTSNVVVTVGADLATL